MQTCWCPVLPLGPRPGEEARVVSDSFLPPVSLVHVYNDTWSVLDVCLLWGLDWPNIVSLSPSPLKSLHCDPPILTATL